MQSGRLATPSRRFPHTIGRPLHVLSPMHEHGHTMLSVASGAHRRVTRLRFQSLVTNAHRPYGSLTVTPQLSRRVSETSLIPLERTKPRRRTQFQRPHLPHPLARDCERRLSENRSSVLPATLRADRLCATPVLEASDRKVNAPEVTHIEVVRHVAAVRPAPRSWIDMRAVI